MRPGGQRRKGHDFERWFARWLRSRGIAAKRGWQSRGGGKEEADVETDLPIHFELAHGAAPSPWAKYRQATADKKPGEMAVVIVKRDGGKPMIFMRLDDWGEMLDAWAGESAP